MQPDTSPPFVKIKDVHKQICSLSPLKGPKHSSGCERQCNAVVLGGKEAELLDITQGARVENQFPFHHDLSPVPMVVSSLHHYLLPLTSPLSKPPLHCCLFFFPFVNLSILHFYLGMTEQVQPPLNKAIKFPKPIYLLISCLRRFKC